MLALMNSVKIMLLVVLSGIILFLICSGGGRLMVLFKPLVWVFTFPIIGPFIFIITGLVIYAVLMKTPSPGWKRNEKYIFYLLLFTMAGGFLSSSEHSGLMFMLTCLVGVSYPIIQIVRFETKNVARVIKIFK